MIIPHDQAQETVRMSLAGEYTHSHAETNVAPLAGRELPILQAPKPDVTAWPADAPRPPFTVGGVYRFRDIWNRERTALIYTEQHARVDGCWWHVSELPAGAVAVGTFTPDPALIADARRFAREIENSQRWS